MDPKVGHFRAPISAAFKGESRIGLGSENAQILGLFGPHSGRPELPHFDGGWTPEVLVARRDGVVRGQSGNLNDSIFVMPAGALEFSMSMDLGSKFEAGATRIDTTAHR